MTRSLLVEKESESAALVRKCEDLKTRLAQSEKVAKPAEASVTSSTVERNELVEVRKGLETEIASLKQKVITLQTQQNQNPNPKPPRLFMPRLFMYKIWSVQIGFDRLQMRQGTYIYTCYYT